VAGLPPQLLLDEPTNNLDLVSTGQPESALTAFRGAFVVVSHDERFLEAIGGCGWRTVTYTGDVERRSPRSGRDS